VACITAREEPLVSGGKVVRDDDGQPLAIRRYSHALTLALLKARPPDRFKHRRVSSMTFPTGVAEHLEAARLAAAIIWLN
jgi:hypothetical protein